MPNNEKYDSIRVITNIYHMKGESEKMFKINFKNLKRMYDYGN